jgi:hypothetical protein
LPVEVLGGDDQSAFFGLLSFLLGEVFAKRVSDGFEEGLDICTGFDSGIINLGGVNLVLLRKYRNYYFRESMERDVIRFVGKVRLQVFVVDNIREVGADGIKEDKLGFNVLENDVLIHVGGVFLALEQVFFLHTAEVIKTILEDISESHAVISFVGFNDALINFVGESMVNPLVVLISGVFSHLAEVVNSPLDPGFEVSES